MRETEKRDDDDEKFDGLLFGGSNIEKDQVLLDGWTDTVKSVG